MDRNDVDGLDVDVTMLLADAAQVADGKLYVLGGGITSIGPDPQPLAIALLLAVPWDRANIPHDWRLDLVDEDGRSVEVGGHPVAVAGRFEAGRPAGVRPGTPLTVPVAIGFNGLPVQAGRRYRWQLAIDGTSRPSWQVAFTVRG
ncbi:MAG: hypothetical protein MUE34_04465 [Acidimicrobiales bacterium]|nr:hypothetical protein [Acidimicrobiales bacterium]